MELASNTTSISLKFNSDIVNKPRNELDYNKYDELFEIGVFKQPSCTEISNQLNVTEYGSSKSKSFISNNGSSDIISLNGTQCLSFVTSIGDAAKIIVDHIAKKAEENISKSPKGKNREGKEKKFVIPLQFLEVPDNLWLSIDHFTIYNGMVFINQYIRNHTYLMQEWKYSITYERAYTDEVSDIHLYQVIFSLPSNAYPISQATVSVFFYMEVCRVIPAYCSVEVYFIIEGNRTRIHPEKSVLTDDMLLQILNIKLQQFSRIKF